MSYSRTKKDMIASIRRAIDQANDRARGAPINIIVVQRIQMLEPVLLDVVIEVRAKTAEEAYDRIQEAIRWPFTGNHRRPSWIEGYRVIDAGG